MTRFVRAISVCVLATSMGCSGAGASGSGEISGSGRFMVEAWADNWFAMYLGDDLIVEDSVPITTVRSFNAEKALFDADYPMNLNFILKDYEQDETGLEYIGTPQQQMGDGGFIVQITDTVTGKVVGVSSAAWKCKVINKGPTNVSCASDSNPEQTCMHEIVGEPDGWKDAGYDVSGWESATVYSAAEVGPKEGYDEISWSSSAQLIWSSNLKVDNTVLCKYTLTGP